MAAETFRIEIPITVKDNTDPGVSSAKAKMTAFDKQNEKTKKRLDEMNKTKWKVAIEAVDKVTGVISKIGGAVKGVAGKAWSFTVSAIDKVTAPVKSMISVLGKLLGVSSAVSTILGGLTVKNALDASAEAARMTTQLRVSAKNMGIDESGIQRILDKANNIQKTTMYSDDAFTGAAAELATYFSETEAITRMMDVVADYAAGMSGGVELSTEQIVDYTTNLAKMTTGAYDAMTKKGFMVTDAQKEILKSGTDMEKVAVIEDIIRENWDGMAKAMSNTPTGQMARLKNSWGDISEMIGNKLTPGVTGFFKMLNTKMPAISKLVERAADKAGSWLEDILPSLETWIDGAIETVEKFADRVSMVLDSDEFKNADFFGKVKIAWNKIIAEPFGEWWDSTGRAWFADKASHVGEAIGSGLTTGLLALLGIDISQTVEDGTSVGGAFIEGFKKGFDTEKITQALKEWAENNKEVVIAIGAVVGFNLITGLAGKINDLTSLFKGKGSKDGGTGGGLGDFTTTCTTATVNGNIVNVYGKTVNDMTRSSGGGSGIGTALKNLLPSLGGAAIGGKLLTSGGQLLLGGGSGTPLLTGEVAGGAAAAGGLTSAGSWLSSLLQLGSTSSVIGADGTLVAVEGGLGGALGSVGSAVGGSASSAAGMAGIGAGAIGGIIAGVLTLISSGIDVYQGTQADKAGDSKAAKDEYVTAGTKVGIAGLGAGGGALAGAAIGAAGGPIGAGAGALIGLAIGGIGALLGGDSAGKAISDGTDEGGWLSNAWESTKKFFTEDLGNFFTKTIPDGWNKMWGGISNFFTNSIPQWWGNLKEKVSTFFTETIPEKWDEMWEGIGNFFTEDVPYAIGYACGKIEIFFTETIPGFFGDLWDGISTFFTDTLPTWASDTWNNHIVPFFTESIPSFFEGLWNGIVTFFTETLPNWVTSVWNNNIVPFFTETIPGFFTQLWNGVTSFVTETIPRWISSIGSTISGWFSSIGDWFSNLWSGIKGAFTSGYNDATGKHAWGGIMNSPHMAMVAEDGAEAIIPLSPSKRARGLDLWMNAGQLLGVQPYEDGGIVGNTTDVSTATATGGGGNNVEIKVEVNPEFIIQAKDAGFDGESLVALIKAHIREMVDDIGDELAERLARVFANMPVKGVA